MQGYSIRRPHPPNFGGENNFPNAAFAGFRSRLRRDFQGCTRTRLPPSRIRFAARWSARTRLHQRQYSPLVDNDYATVGKAGQRCFQRRLLRGLRRLGYGVTTPSSLS